jgi:hypothetical protein
VITPGLQALGLDFLLLVKDAVASFEDFDADDDPYGEHDFGTARVQGHTLFFKIDYYNRSLNGHSPHPADPADPAVTTRVLTIMLAEEY